MDRTARAALRAALLGAAPWLEDPDHGPRTVDAGPCDRCGGAPRLVASCGPAAPGAVCGRCLVELDDDAWCGGHRADGSRARAWVRGLPDRYEDAVLLWWVATGEVRLDRWPDAPVDVGSQLGVGVGAALRAAGVTGAQRH